MQKENKVKYLRFDILYIFIFIFLANIFITIFISQEKYIYFWDYSLYWGKYLHLTNLANINPSQAFRELINSLNHTYSDLSIAPLIPFHLVIGRFLSFNPRLEFILAITNTYAFLFAISFLMLFRLTLKKANIQNISWIDSIPIFVIITFPFFWDPLLWSSPAAGGLIGINLILYIYFPPV